MATPSIPITDPKFVYLNSVTTDIRNLWRRHGWVPPQRMQVRVCRAEILQAGRVIATVDRIDRHATLIDIRTTERFDWSELERQVQNVLR